MLRVRAFVSLFCNSLNILIISPSKEIAVGEMQEYKFSLINSYQLLYIFNKLKLHSFHSVKYKSKSNNNSSSLWYVSAVLIEALCRNVIVICGHCYFKDLVLIYTVISSSLIKQLSGLNHSCRYRTLTLLYPIETC